MLIAHLPHLAVVNGNDDLGIVCRGFGTAVHHLTQKIEQFDLRQSLIILGYRFFIEGGDVIPFFHGARFNPRCL